MVKETVQSLKAENEKLKKRVEDVFDELKQLQDLFKTKRADGHVESTSEDTEQVKSLEYLSKEYDDLAIFRQQVGNKLNAIEKTLSGLLLKNFHRPSIRLKSTVTHIMSSWLVFPSSNNVKVPMKHHNSV